MWQKRKNNPWAFCLILSNIEKHNIYANVWGFLGHNGEDPIIMAALLIIFSHSCWQVVWCLCHGSYLSISQHSRVKLSVLRLWNDYDSNRSWWKTVVFKLPSKGTQLFAQIVFACVSMDLALALEKWTWWKGGQTRNTTKNN